MEFIKWLRNALNLHPKCLGCGERHEDALTHKKLHQMRKFANAEEGMMVGPGHPMYEVLMAALKSSDVQMFEKDPHTGEIRKVVKH